MYSLISKSGFSTLDRWVEKRNQRKIQERAAKEKRDEQSQVCLSISSLSALRYSCLPWQGIFHPVTVVRKKKLVNVDLPPLFQAGQREWIGFFLPNKEDFEEGSPCIKSK